MKNIEIFIEWFIKCVRSGHTPPRDILEEIADYLEQNPPTRPRKGRPDIGSTENQMLASTYVWLLELFEEKEAKAILADELFIEPDSIRKRITKACLDQAKRSKQHDEVFLDFSQYAKSLRDTDREAFTELQDQAKKLKFTWRPPLEGGPRRRVITLLYPEASGSAEIEIQTIPEWVDPSDFRGLLIGSIAMFPIDPKKPTE